MRNHIMRDVYFSEREDKRKTNKVTDNEEEIVFELEHLEDKKKKKMKKKNNKTKVNQKSKRQYRGESIQRGILYHLTG